MKRLCFIFLAASLLLSVNSCNKDDGPNFHFKALRIVSAELPESFQLNQTYQIIVTYEKPDNCTTFGGFEVTEKGTTIRNVIVVGTVRTDQEACAQVIAEDQASFNFICKYDETYLFRFWQGEGADGEQQFFEVEVPVN